MSVNKPDSEEMNTIGDIPPPDMRNVRIMKIVVISLGVMLVVGTILLITMIGYRASKMKSEKTGRGFDDVMVELAAGDEVRQMVVDGNRMVVHTGSEIIVVDISKGELLGRVKFLAK